jgi:hypothetical protein
MPLPDVCARLACCAFLAVLGGCGAAPAFPTPPQPVDSAQAIVVHRDLRRSWMASDARKTDLLYVSDVGTGDVDVYSYPKGKLEGTLTGFAWPAGLCVDEAGNVYITDLQASQIFEYSHGGTSPIATLKDPREEPGDCAVDSTTGNLAVTNVSSPYSKPGNVVIYKAGIGKPKSYKDSEISYYEFCGYDNRGNLYVDGVKAGAFALAELPSGQTSFTNITVKQHFAYAGAVQWDGSDLAVGDYESNVIYRFKIDGDTGTKVGTTHLRHAKDPIGFWIAGSKVVGPNDDSANVMVWKYPAGGSPIKTIGGLHDPWGATVSPAT